MATESVARYEFKYAIHASQLDAVRERLARYCSKDQTGFANASGFYMVDTLYFDTPSDGFFRAGERGEFARVKLRVRTYPDDLRPVAKIEVKRRLGELVSKTGLVVPIQDWQGLVTGAIPSKDPALNTFLGYAHVLHARPRMLIRYSRQAWFSDIDDYMRVTFDQRMMYQPMSRYELAGDPVRWTSLDGVEAFGGPGFTLMEVKFKFRPPLWAADLVRSFDLSRIGFSKYTLAMQRENYIYPQQWELTAATRRSAYA